MLDTQIVLWWIEGDQKLKTPVRNYIAGADKVFVSTVTFWEMIIKKQLNKLTVPDNIRQLVADQDFATLSFETDHAFVIDTLPLLHRDPFDRALTAQSISESLTFVTHDRTINSQYGDYVLLFDARSQRKND